MLLEEYISRKQAFFMAPIAPEELKNEVTRYYGKWKYGMELKTEIGLYKEPSLSPTPGRDGRHFMENKEPERLHTWGAAGIVRSGVRHWAGNREIK